MITTAKHPYRPNRTSREVIESLGEIAGAAQHKASLEALECMSGEVICGRGELCNNPRCPTHAYSDNPQGANYKYRHPEDK